MEGLSAKIRALRTEEGYRGFAEEVKQASHGGRVLLFRREDRAGKEASAALTALGLTVTTELSDEKGIDVILSKEYPESVMAVAAVGGDGEMQAAKAVRLGRPLPRVLFPTRLSALSALDERAFFAIKGDVVTLLSEGHTVLFDPALLEEGIPDGAGWILARLLEIADGGYRRLIEEGKSPTAALSLFREGCSLLKEIREENAVELLLQTALRLEEGIQREDLRPADSAHRLAFLLEKGVGGSAASHLFAAAYTLLKLYARYLGDLPLEHAVPPDPVKNAELLLARAEMRGIDFDRLPLYADHYASRYRTTAEYREDFAECFSEETLPLAALCRVYRRTRKSGEGELASPSDLLTLLSLTGEIVSGYSLIRHIKMTGVIEPLTACG